MHTNTHRNTNTNTITGRQNMQMANYAHCVYVCVCATNLILSKPQIDKYFNLHNKHTHTHRRTHSYWHTYRIF